VSSAAPPPRPRSGSRRDDEARRRVLRSADDLLVAHGFAKLTIEAIAREAGVAKQTIYRWWPSKVEILLDALLEGVDKHLTIPEGQVGTADVENYFDRLRAFVEGSDDGRVLLALLGHAQHDAGAADLLRRRFLDPRRSAELELLDRAAEPASAAGRERELDARVGAIFWRAMTRSKQS